MKTIWQGNGRSQPRVIQDRKGGLWFCYFPWQHISGGECKFSLWSEVGEKYKADFAPFFKSHKLSEKPVEYLTSPYYADTLAS